MHLETPRQKQQTEQQESFGVPKASRVHRSIRSTAQAKLAHGDLGCGNQRFSCESSPACTRRHISNCARRKLAARQQRRKLALLADTRKRLRRPLRNSALKNCATAERASRKLRQSSTATSPEQVRHNLSRTAPTGRHRALLARAAGLSQIQILQSEL